MNIYIGFTLSPKSHAKNRLVAVLNYFLPKKDQPIQMAYIMIIVIITPMEEGVEVYIILSDKVGSEVRLR